MFKFTFYLMTLHLAGSLLISVPSTNAQHWTSNFLNYNLFSDNFRNLLQQIPTAPLPTTSLSSSSLNSHLISQPSLTNSPLPSLASNLLSPSLNSPLYNAYGRYSRSKDEILQYSDEDALNNNGLAQQNSRGLQANNNGLQQTNPYSAAYDSFTNDYYNYPFADHNGLVPTTHQTPNTHLNQLPKASQFDADPLYDQYMLAKSNLNRNKNVDNSINLNRNINWDDDNSNLGLNLNAYNLNNIYNNKFNYNRVPVIPQHVAFVPPPQPVTNDLQQSPGTSSSLVNNPNPQSAYSSFLANNKAALSNFDYNLAPANQLISNSVEQQYEQAKPFFSQERPKSILNIPNSSSNTIPNPIPNPIPNSISNNLQVPINSPVPNSLATATNYPALPDLNQLYNTFALIPFNSNNFNQANQVKNPSVIYYDNFINHQASAQPISSSSLTVPAVNSPISSSAVSTLKSNGDNLSPIKNSASIDQPQFNSDQTGSIQSSLITPSVVSSEQFTTTNNLNSINNLTTGAIAPNLSSNLEVTPQPQLTAAIAKAGTRKKPVKVKRKHQRTNQRDFGTRQKKDELVAVEK